MRILILIWLITTFILRLLFTSDIQALLLAKREIDIDSFEQLIEMTNIIPMIEENSVRLKRKWEKIFHFRSHIQTPHD